VVSAADLTCFREIDGRRDVKGREGSERGDKRTDGKENST